MKTNLEILLGEWGRMQAGQNRTGLGFPSCAAFTNERVQQSNRDEIYVLMADDDIRMVNAAIQRLHPDMRVVVTAQYVWPGVVKVKAHRLSMTPREYYRELDSAQRLLSHAMGGKYTTGFEPKLCPHIEHLCPQM